MSEEAGRIAEGVESGSTGGVKFDTYQLPGGTSYREVLLTLPPGVVPSPTASRRCSMVTAACDLTQAKSRSA